MDEGGEKEDINRGHDLLGVRGGRQCAQSGTRLGDLRREVIPKTFGERAPTYLTTRLIIIPTYRR